MSKREFHFSEGTSNKFWAISLFKNSYTVTYGRIGTVGQAKTKELATPEEAQKALCRLLASSGLTPILH
jgi:predicted DNA-binding WGR domain protein